MNGPQHYAEAEKYLSAIREGDVHGNVQAIAQVAQAHATLALAAATVLAGLDSIDDAASEFYDTDDAIVGKWLKAMEAK